MKKMKTYFFVVVFFISMMQNQKVNAADDMDKLVFNKIENAENTGSSINMQGIKDSDLVSINAITLNSCNLYYSFSSNSMDIVIYTSATATATEIGVENLQIQVKTSSGWKSVASGSDCSYNSLSYTGIVNYSGVVKGSEYRVVCTHYAIINGTKYTRSNQTSASVF